MLRIKRLGFVTVAATIAVSAVLAPAALAQSYTMFLPDGTPVRVAQSSPASFMDYTDDSCMAFDSSGAMTRGLATRSGDEVCVAVANTRGASPAAAASDYTVDHPISSTEEARARGSHTPILAEELAVTDSRPAAG
jgi:hypothetical protein